MLTDDSSPTTTPTKEHMSGTKALNEEGKMKNAFEAFQSVSTKPVRDKYENRLKRDMI